MDQQSNKTLIRKYLNGACSPDELLQMEQFLQREDAQQLIDEVWIEAWEEFQDKELSDQEIARWKERFLQNRLPRHSELAPVSQKRIRRFFTFPYAAIWIGALLAVGIWYSAINWSQQEKTSVAVTWQEHNNPNGQRAKIRLPDSSVVYLGGGSSLVYPDRFVDSTREIRLRGEAFFEVAKNPNKPFIVQTGPIQTRVLGTSFRIDAFEGEPLRVEVATGKVQVERRQEDSLSPLAILMPGQRLAWSNHQAIVGLADANVIKEWKHGKLAFNGATLKELTSVIERWYGVSVVFSDPKKAKQQITITLTATVPLTEILDVLAATAKFGYRVNERKIIIN